MASRGGRAVFGVNAAVSVVLVVMVAAIALVVNPPSPPGIAAFAPQAAKPITKAPPAQSSVNGAGAGACADGQACTATKRPTPAPTRGAVAGPSAPPSAGPAKGVPSALQCYTWPDGTTTQTFDPQSPPCVASWPEQAKGNGGATSQGVTSTTVKVAFPKNGPASLLPQLAPLVNFFNTRYQLYGRKIVLAPYDSKETADQKAGSTSANPTFQKADAEAAASLKPFAAMDFVDGTPYKAATANYLSPLAAKKVITLAGGTIAPNVSRGELAAHHPYEWTYQPTADVLLANVGHLICQQLVGRPAAHATSFVATTRKFAILLPDVNLTGSALPGLDGLKKILTGCGISSPPVVYYTGQPGGASALSASFVKLRNSGVTSLVFYPQLGAGGQASPQKIASNTGYRPEWVTAGYYHWAVAGLTAGAADETRSTFGVGAWNKLFPLPQTTWVQAFGLGGGDTAQAGRLFDGEAVYHELLMLAQGIQMAGPNLTPTTFATAMQSTELGNPGAGHAPGYQARVGFDPDRHTMMQDFAGFSMDPSANAASTTAAGAGQALNAYQTFCYVRLGLRWADLSWPRQDDFYKGCR